MVIFQVHTNMKTKPYCVKCGERFEVRRYHAERTDKKSKVKLRWTQEELEILNKCINKELEPHQVAIITGRSINSIIKKVARVKRETDKTN